ncbi:MAG: hypothetical protein U0M41_00225 [Negativibacillus sp.]|nr:hypothetical protein [Negativibacillus sp.]
MEHFQKICRQDVADGKCPPSFPSERQHRRFDPLTEKEGKPIVTH